MSWCLHLLHHKAVLSSPEEQGKREDPQPDSFAAVGWPDCPGSSRNSIRQQDKECIVLQHEDFGGQLMWVFNTMCWSTLKAQRSLSLINNKMVMLLLLQQLGVQQERNNNNNNMKNNNKNITQSLKSWYCAPISTMMKQQQQQQWCPWLTMTMSLHQRITQLPTKLWLVLMPSSVVGHIV